MNDEGCGRPSSGGALFFYLQPPITFFLNLTHEKRQYMYTLSSRQLVTNSIDPSNVTLFPIESATPSSCEVFEVLPEVTTESGPTTVTQTVTSEKTTSETTTSEAITSEAITSEAITSEATSTVSKRTTTTQPATSPDMISSGVTLTEPAKTGDEGTTTEPVISMTTSKIELQVSRVIMTSTSNSLSRILNLVLKLTCSPSLSPCLLYTSDAADE